ncbi:DUF397 domain-containing protein [Streptomyces sp. B1866]|uniref:DUF397 domain-containing protein n=1 Tax=Streptomyces sp. B1866 TaxID=3075431 RepID=UPI0028927063|nr:DUF397 domain-containing protein [Streptomyces sp. B1866]MDT3395627.1 DUF397 domain-containing protein [Streptomyces sp. B1866]
MNTRPATVTASELEGARWFTSSYSNDGGECVEVADLTNTAHGAVAVRDSKNPEGPALLLAPEQFAAFITGIRAGGLGR